MKANIRIEITIGTIRLLYSSINNPRIQFVRGKNGFIQIGRAAIIWGVS